MKRRSSELSTAGLCVVLGLVIALSGVAVGDSVEIEGVSFARTLRIVDDVELELHRVALLRYRIFFKGYVAALYKSHQIATEKILDDVPKRLEIEYFWSIGADDFQQATLDGIAKNVESKAFDDLQRPIAEINRLYRDVQPGDRYALTYLPGHGTELALNGNRLGSVEGAQFSAALFGIWLGEVPFDEALKSDLLGASTPP